MENMEQKLGHASRTLLCHVLSEGQYCDVLPSILYSFWKLVNNIL